MDYEILRIPLEKHRGVTMENMKLAQAILSSYSFIEPSIEFVRHHENMIFKVKDQADGKDYTLRIHSPATAGLSGVQHTLAGLQSEMALLHELIHSQFDRVQQPIANSNGDYVTPYQASEASPLYYATLVTWIEGPTLSFEENNRNEAAFALGETLALFHEATCNKESLKQLTRPQYDASRIDSAIDELKVGIELELYTPKQYEVIKETLIYIKSLLNELDQQESTWGIIHADIQLGNVILANGRPNLIDFSLCGHGYYLFDIASASFLLPDDLRTIFLEGYSSHRPFTNQDLKYVEGFMLMDAFISYMFFIHDVNRNGWIKAHTADVCDTLCQDFMEGKAVYNLLH